MNTSMSTSMSTSLAESFDVLAPKFPPTFAPTTLPGLLMLLTVFEFPQEVQVLNLQGVVIPKTTTSTQASRELSQLIKEVLAALKEKLVGRVIHQLNFPDNLDSSNVPAAWFEGLHIKCLHWKALRQAPDSFKAAVVFAACSGQISSTK